MLVFLHILVTNRSAKVTNITYLPTWDRHPDYTVLPIGQALQQHQAPAGELRTSYRRTTSVVGRIGRLLEPIPGRLP